MKRTAFTDARGFSNIQLIITIAVMTIVASFAVVSISRARDNVRLMNSARQFAAYVERARGDAVRRHGEAVVQAVNTTTYSVQMDFGYTGAATSRTFTLERGITFTSDPKTIRFNWRGRIDGEQVFTFTNGRTSVNVGVTGAGDVTFGSHFFHDGSVPQTVLIGTGGPVADVTPSPVGSGSPSPSPSPSTSPSPGASPTPTPTPTATPTPTPTPTPTATATPTPTPTPTATATPTPTPPSSCSLTLSQTTMSLSSRGEYKAMTVKLTGASGTVTASGGTSTFGPYPTSQTLTSGQTVTFYIYTLDGAPQGTHTITFTSPCNTTGTLTLTVTKN